MTQYYWTGTITPQSKLARLLLRLAYWWDNVPKSVLLGTLTEEDTVTMCRGMELFTRYVPISILRRFFPDEDPCDVLNSLNDAVKYVKPI